MKASFFFIFHCSDLFCLDFLLLFMTPKNDGFKSSQNIRNFIILKLIFYLFYFLERINKHREYANSAMHIQYTLTRRFHGR